MDFYDQLENCADQGDPELSAEVALYRVLKLLLRENQTEPLYSQWLALL